MLEVYSLTQSTMTEEQLDITHFLTCTEKLTDQLQDHVSAKTYVYKLNGGWVAEQWLDLLGK